MFAFLVRNFVSLQATKIIVVHSKKEINVVLHPHGIAPTFLKFDAWSPEAGFIPIISTKAMNQINKGKL